MAVRRLDPDQPAHFAFSPENLAWAKAQIAKFPPGKQAAAIIPLFWRAQEQEGWLSEPAIRTITDMLGMAHIRGLEVATFYTMFQLSPVGSVAHVQVCGTTPCMLRGSRDLVHVCERRIAHDQHHISADGKFSWEEVECLGACANAPMVQIGKDVYEDLTPETLEAILDTFAAGGTPAPGSQTGRTASCPAGGPTTLTDPSLYDGSTIGAWKKRFEETGGAGAPAPSTPPAPSTSAPPAAPAAPAASSAPAAGATPSPSKESVHPGALTAMANAGLVDDLNKRAQGKPLSVDELARLKTTPPPASHPQTGEGAAALHKPELLSAPRNGKGDDLSLIWGVAEKLAERLNAMGIWHFEQIAQWGPEQVAWFENEVPGFKGRVARDKWIEQCKKLATGWRPGSDVGERPKE